MAASILCPFHLGDVVPQEVRQGRYEDPAYRCPDAACGKRLSRIYVQQYPDYPPEVLNFVGFPGHGKTVALSAMIHALENPSVAVQLPGYHNFPLDEPTIEIFERCRMVLDSGRLPAVSPPNIFRRPAIVRLKGLPVGRDCHLLCYDTSGESFQASHRIREYARFVKHATTAVFLVSLPKLRDEGASVPHAMDRLLRTYVHGMRDMGADTSRQNLIVAYTCADDMGQWFDAGWESLHDHLARGRLEGLARPDAYVAGVHRLSEQLLDFTFHGLQAAQFVESAFTEFRSVSFSLLSALGRKPRRTGQRGGTGRQYLPGPIDPRRVLDPLLLVLDKSKHPLTVADVRNRFAAWLGRQFAEALER